MLISEATFVVTDTETTGSRAGDDRVIEIGAVKVQGGEITESFQRLINPGRHIPRRISQITGISTGMVFDQPTAEEVLPEFLDFLGDAVFVAHNLPFDLRFLEVELEIAGLEGLRNPCLDTLRLARRLYSALPSKGLSKLTRYFEIEVNGRHRALGDAEATAQLLLLFIDRLRTEFGIETVDGLLGFQRRRYRDTRREPSHLKRIRAEVLPNLPDLPGVYFMRDRRNAVIYVGKAKSLKNRVRSYFAAVDNHRPEIRRLVRDVRDITWEETGTELSALIEESKAIKRHTPAYNRLQLKYRDYSFLRLDTTHAFPTLSRTVCIHSDGAEYYGPISRRKSADEMVELINRLFQLRECDDGTFALGRPCLYHDMGRCAAPCVGGEAEAAYPMVVEQVRTFLAGRDDTVLDMVEEAMLEASAMMEYEQAGWFRNQLGRLRRALNGRRQLVSAVHDHHAVLLEPLADGSGTQLFLIRYGRLVARINVPTDPSPAHEAETRSALTEHFDPSLPPPERFDRPDVDEIRIIAHWMGLRENATKQVQWVPDTVFEEFEERIRNAMSRSPHLDVATEVTTDVTTEAVEV